MTIKVGDRLPETKFRMMTPEGPVWKSTSDIFKGRKVVLFGLPGAFTSTCSNMHLPGYLQNHDAIKAKGVDANAEFAKAMDLTFDGSVVGLGMRSKRYSMVVEDGVVRSLNIEEQPGKAEI